MLASIIMGAGRTANLFGATGGSDGDESSDKKPTGPAKKVMGAILETPKAIMKMAGKGLGMAGISLSVSSLLRQSQLFTGTIGALFQVLGGFVDVILAPFMPYLAKFIGKMGQYIPIVQEYAQKVHDWLAENIFPIIAQWAGYIWDAIKIVWGYIKEAWDWLSALPWGDYIKSFWDFAVEIGTNIWGKIQEIWDIIGPKIADVRSTVWGFIKETIWPIVESLWGLFKVVSDKILFPLIKLGFKFYGFLWDYVGKPIFKVLGFLLKDVPASIDSITNFIAAFFEFQWLKNMIATILDGILWLTTAIGKIPMVNTDEAQKKYQAAITKLRGEDADGGKVQFRFEQTTVIDGLAEPPQQEVYDLMNRKSILEEKKVEINLESNALEPFMPI